MTTTERRFYARLLGGLTVIRPDGTTVEFPTQKARALFAIIAAAETGGVDRSVAAAMLWSRGSDTQARTNLRQTLASIRKALDAPTDVITSRGTVLCMDTDALDTDIAAIDRGDAAPFERDRAGSTEFLEGVTLNEPAFSGWLEHQRAIYRNACSALLFDVAEALLETGDASEALTKNARLLALDEFDEGAHRQAMRILNAKGGAGRAMMQFEKLKRLLSDELGVEPSKATKDLAASISMADEALTAKKGPAPPATPRSLSTGKTTVSILPFEILSVPDDDGFAAGLTSDIATDLARFKTLDVKHAAQTADYVVRGTIQRAGNRHRVSIQLMNAAGGNVIWANRYDREQTDLFALQDELARAIVATLPGRIQADVSEAAIRREVDSLSAHQLMLRGKALRDTLSVGKMVEARSILERAVALDPSCARAYMYLSDTYVVDRFLGVDDANTARLALEHARSAVAADSTDVFIQDHLGFAFLSNAMWSEGEAQIARTLSMIENEVESNAWCAYALLLLGDHAGALREVMGSTPRDPVPPATFGWIRGQVFSFTGDHAAAADELMGSALLNSLAWAFLAGSQARLGRKTEAETALEGFVNHRRQELASRDMSPASDSVDTLAAGFRPMWRREQDYAHIADGLNLAGLPD